MAAERDRRPSRRTGRVARAEKRVGAANIVFDPEEVGRPLGERNAVADEVANLVDAPSRQASDGPVIDQERRALIAHSGAGGEIDAHSAISRNFAGRELQALEHVLEQGQAAEHAVGDVVGKQDPIAAARFVIQEGVELDHALDQCHGDAETGGDGASRIG